MRNSAELFKKMMEELNCRPTAKITIERDGKDPIVIEEVTEYVVMAQKEEHLYNYNQASVGFLVTVGEHLERVFRTHLAEVFKGLMKP